jgi:hypothetical protein
MPSRGDETTMKRTLLALSAMAALTAVSAGVANAQGGGVGPGGVYVGPDHDQGYSDRGFRDRGDNCRIVITHRRGPNGSITVRRRICD